MPNSIKRTCMHRVSQSLQLFHFSQDPSMAVFFLFTLTLLSLLSLSSPIPSQTILDAAEILSNSGFVSMALTLELVSPQTTISQYPSVTVFSPPESSFVKSGQPTLSLLQFHFSPMAFSYESLESLPFGTKIPTMSPEYSLVVTTRNSNDRISLNNVTIIGSPIYDDGALIVFGIEDFFDPNYLVLAPAQSPSPNIGGCVVSKNRDATDSSNEYPFQEASRSLRSKGFSVISSFLDLQLLLGFNDETKLTVFAPTDVAMETHVGNYSEYSSIFLRHVVSCKLSQADLENVEDETMLKTYSDGFMINVTRSGGILMLNGVVVSLPDLYSNDWLVVHGLDEFLSSPGRPVSEDVAAEPPSELEGDDKEEIANYHHRGEF